MLKQRLITAAILIPALIWGILSSSTLPGFALILGVCVIAGVFEWMRLIRLNQPSHRWSYLIIVISALLSSLVIMQSGFFFGLFLSASVAWWVYQLIQLPSYVGEPGFDDGSEVTNFWTGIMLLVPTWAALVFIHQSAEHGPGLVLLLMILIWTADSGAYFAGRKYGKHKLAPLISPGKSKEGAYGAFAATSIVALIGAIWLSLSFFQFIFFILLCMIVVGFSIGGDLLESVYKRKAEVKDSGAILPGHGGMLDRIDSLMAAAPVFALGIWVLGIIK